MLVIYHHRPSKPLNASHSPLIVRLASSENRRQVHRRRNRGRTVTMALTETFITLDEYVDERNDQDRLLKAEFTKLHTKIDRVDKKIDGVEDSLLNKINKVEDSLLKTINKVETYIVHLKGQFERMDAQAHNSRVVNPAARLKPVPAYSPLRGVIWPEEFPRSGGEFLK